MTQSTTMTGLSASTPANEREGLSWWESFSFSITHAVVSRLLLILTLPGLYRFARLFGTVEWVVNHKRRRRFIAAYRKVLGHEPTASQRRRASREFFTQSRCDRLFYLVFDRIPRDKVVSLFSIDQPDILKRSVARGGVYLATAHHGSMHLLGLFLVACGYKTAGVRDPNEGAMRRYIQNRLDRRESQSQRLRLLYSGHYPRDIYRCFQDGYILGSSMDIHRVRDPKQKMIEVDIFGEKRMFLTGPLRTAIRCRVPALQVFLIPETNFRYRLEIAEVLFDPETASADHDDLIPQAVHNYTANVEVYMKGQPHLMTRI